MLISGVIAFNRLSDDHRCQGRENGIFTADWVGERRVAICLEALEGEDGCLGQGSNDSF